jgi:diacylglycerol kinase
MTALLPMLPTADPIEQPAPRKPRRSMKRKLRETARGLKLGIRGHSSFFVHFFFAALVLAAGIVLHCALLEWCLLLGCIGAVLTAELFNSALETLVHGLEEPAKTRVRPCLDIGGGAVLLASIMAMIVGSLVFLNRLLLLFARGE